MVNTLTSGRWLITGGCGFIGLSLVNSLLRREPSLHIRILDNLSVGLREDLQEIIDSIERVQNVRLSGVEFVEGDIRDAETCSESCEDVDVVVHLAANSSVPSSVQDPKYDMHVNIAGTLNMLEAARFHNVGKFIFASSAAVIGDIDPPVHENIIQRPVSPYGVSKLAGESYCYAYFKTFDIKTVSLRFANVYGPLSKHKNSVVAKFIKRAIAGEILEVFGDGSQTRDFIYIDDLIEAILLAVQTDIGGEVFQIATYKETTVNELAEKIKTIIDSELGTQVKITHGIPRPGDIKRNYSDISKAKRLLGFSPKVNLEEGLMKTFDHLRLSYT